MTQTAPAGEQPKKSGILKYLVIGCLGFLLLCVIVCAVGGYLVVTNARSIAGSAATSIARSAVNDLPLPGDQKTRINAQINRVADEFKAKRLTVEQVGEVLQHVVQSPELLVGGMYYTAKNHITRSALDEAAKNDAHTTMMRLASGFLDGTIDEGDLRSVTAPLFTTNNEGEQVFRATLPDEELRKLIRSAREVVEAAGVPTRVPEPDFAAAVERSVDQALSGTATQP